MVKNLLIDLPHLVRRTEEAAIICFFFIFKHILLVCMANNNCLINKIEAHKQGNLRDLIFVLVCLLVAANNSVN